MYMHMYLDMDNHHFQWENSLYTIHGQFLVPILTSPEDNFDGLFSQEFLHGGPRWTAFGP